MKAISGPMVLSVFILASEICSGQQIDPIPPDAVPVMEVSTLPIEFGTATTGSTLTRTFSISNNGTAALNYALSISGTNAADFSISSLYAGVIAPGSFEVVEVTFTPSLPGFRTASLTVSGNDPNNQSDVMTLTGTGRLSQTITFDEVPAKTYGDGPFELNATASSGLPVTFSSLDPTTASVNGNVLTIHKAGTVVIRALQFGNPTYIGAMVEQELIIAKAVLTVTSDDKTISYGDSISVFTVSYVGFIGGDNVSDLDLPPRAGIFVETAENGQFKGAGVHSISILEGTDDNYTFEYFPGSLTINKAILTARADNKTRMVGEQNPLLTITYLGFKGTEDAEYIADIPYTETTAEVESPGGEYPIAVYGGDDSNYELVRVNGVLLITKAIQTISFDAIASKTYGDAPFELTALASSGLPVSFQSSDPTVASINGNLVTIHGAGTVTITATQSGDDSYNEASAEQQLIIGKAVLTAVPDDKLITYGDAVPALTVSFYGFVGEDDLSDIETPPTAYTNPSLAAIKKGVRHPQFAPAGTHSILINNDGIDNNYTFNNSSGILTINKAILTATADNKSRNVGEPNPIFTITYDGFKGTEDIAYLNEVPVASTSADTNSPQGEYPITLTGGEAISYDFVFVDGILSVLPGEKNLYWIGNSGIWTDPAHWSLSSGGVGAGRIPTQVDNVFFDSNSFTVPNQVVNVDVASAITNMDWNGVTNSPSLTGAHLDVLGSLRLSANMNLNNYFSGISFLGDAQTNTITLAGMTLYADVAFDGSGKWTLLDDFRAKKIVHYRGHLDTNGKSLTVFEDFSTMAGYGPLSLTLRSSTVLVRNWYNMNSDNLSLDAGTSSITLWGFDFRAGSGTTYYNVTVQSLNHNPIRVDGGNTSFNNLTLSSSGSINGSNRINNLVLSPGASFTFQSGMAQTIVSSLTMSGSCSALATLQSSVATTPAFLLKESGAIQIDYVSLKGINAGGGATFTATNAVDLGNNSGWTITAPVGRNFYWIGGPGSWTEAAHWSLSSGGPSAGCVPTKIDDVFFDGNSFRETFETLFVNTESSVHSMDWSGVTHNPRLTGSSSLNIYGSLTLSTNVILTNFGGIISFMSTKVGNTITTAGKMLTVIYFDGIGGEWKLLDDFNASSIVLNNGTLNTNNKALKLSSFVSPPPGARTLLLGSSSVEVNNFWQLVGGNLNFDAGTSTLTLTGDTFAGGGVTYNNVNMLPTTSGVQRVLTGTNTFNNLTLGSNSDVRNNNTINNLTLNKGATYSFAPLTTQTIVNDLIVSGENGGNTTLRCLSISNPARISKATGSLCLDDVNLSNLQATGGSTFVAGPNSINQGGNQGWIFLAETPAPTVRISASPGNSITAGTNVLFTALFTDGGTSQNFEWKVNGITVQNGLSNIYSSGTLANNDQVTCQFIALYGSCYSKPAVSNSITITLTKSTQTITFDAIGTKTYGDPDFQLVAAASSGLPITFSSTDQSVASVIGNTLTIHKVGQAIIMASQPGNELYLPAVPVLRILTISSASQTITFNPIDPVAFSVGSLQLTATASSGLAVTYTSSDPTVATINGNIVTFLQIGSTLITATQPGNSNFSAAPNVTQTLLITKSNQTITFATLPVKVVGDVPFNLAATSSSGLPVSFQSSNTSVATVTGGTVTIVNAGNTVITASQSGNTNYFAAASVQQTLTVVKPSFVMTPKDGDVNQSTQLTVTAQVQIGASVYTIELSPVNNFSSGVLSQSGSRILNFSGLNYSTKYYARVKTDLSPVYGAVTSFTTSSPLFLTFIVSPVNKSNNVPTTVTVIANLVPGATSYTIQLSTAGGIFATNTSASNSIGFSGLTNNTTFTARVQTNLAPGQWGAASTFTTEKAKPRNNARLGIEPPIEENTAIDVETRLETHPNPFRDKITIYVSASDNESIDVRLFDLRGKEMIMKKGETNKPVELETQVLSIGLYLIKIQCSKGVISQKVMKE